MPCFAQTPDHSLSIVRKWTNLWHVSCPPFLGCVGWSNSTSCCSLSTVAKNVILPRMCIQHCNTWITYAHLMTWFFSASQHKNLHMWSGTVTPGSKRSKVALSQQPHVINQKDFSCPLKGHINPFIETSYQSMRVSGAHITGWSKMLGELWSHHLMTQCIFYLLTRSRAKDGRTPAWWFLYLWWRGHRWWKFHSPLAEWYNFFGDHDDGDDGLFQLG